MKKQKLLTSAFLISTLLLGACGKETGSITRSTKATVETNNNGGTNSNTARRLTTNPNKNNLIKPASLAQSFDNIFANTLFSETDANKNVLVSPYSIVMDFGMLENGADGKALDEMTKYLNGGLSVDELNKFMKTSQENMMDSDFTKWYVANSIWLNQDRIKNLDENYNEKIKEYYLSEVNNRPYNNATLDEINNWVNSNTDGMIPQILDELSPESAMTLINAISFKSDWDCTFDVNKTYKTEFKNSDGSTSNVDMMHSTINGYFANDDYIGYKIAFADNDYSFFAIKSQKGLTPYEMMKKMSEDKETISSIMSKYSTNEKADIGLPKFDVDYDVTLNDALANLGVSTIFTDDADFSKISPDSSELQVSKAIHKTHFDVNENGVKAAAATAIELTEGVILGEEQKNLQINMDESFIYGIYDNTTNLPIFIGCQNSIE